tara:strand:- start:536 stop:760 length:225 start_codon:yes stop_codon:yes gene_type:complete
MTKLTPHHASKSYASEANAQKAIDERTWQNGKYTIFQMVHSEGKHAGSLRFHPVILGTDNLHAIHDGITVWAFA